MPIPLFQLEGEILVLLPRILQDNTWLILGPKQKLLPVLNVSKLKIFNTNILQSIKTCIINVYHNELKFYNYLPNIQIFFQPAA